MSATAAPIGKFVWYEYMGDDLKAAVDFYTHVVGWTAQDAGIPDFEYEIVSAAGAPVAGMMAIPADAKAMGARPSWIRAAEADGGRRQGVQGALGHSECRAVRRRGRPLRGDLHAQGRLLLGEGSVAVDVPDKDEKFALRGQ